MPVVPVNNLLPATAAVVLAEDKPVSGESSEQLAGSPTYFTPPMPSQDDLIAYSAPDEETEQKSPEKTDVLDAFMAKSRSLSESQDEQQQQTQPVKEGDEETF